MRTQEGMMKIVGSNLIASAFNMSPKESPTTIEGAFNKAHDALSALSPSLIGPVPYSFQTK
jgi:hypothetical protein